MGLPSGNFSSAFSGRLQVSFKGQFLTNGGHDFGTGTLNARLRAYVGTGSGRLTAVVDINSQSALIEQDYVGGSGNVAVGMEEIDHTFSGPSSVTIAPLTITCTLVKR